MKENEASIHVLEKTGISFEKIFEAHGAECLQYFITKNK